MLFVSMEINTKIDQWIRDAFKHENFKEITISVTGSSEKGDGYVGEIAFLKVNVVKSDGKPAEYDLVIKYGKLNDNLRESLPVRLAFEKEIYLYSKVIPVFQKFEAEKNMKLLDQFIPKCYATLLYDKEEVIVLENLKALKYELHDKYQPLNINHLKLTFEMYGKWHAISFAFQDQNPEESNLLFKNLEDMLVTFLKAIDIDNYLKREQESLYSILMYKNETKLIKRMKDRIPNFKKTFFELMETEKEKCVLIHGDCWNNNNMFKYGSDKSKPEAVKFLDFQLTNFRPPVFDLAHHLYSVASETELQHFEDLLKIYHKSLSNTLRSLGSDADSLYSYEDLLRQWKKFSAFGVIMAGMILPIALAKQEDTVDIQDSKEASQVTNTVQKTLSENGDILSSRIIAIIKHFLNYDYQI